MLASEMRRSLCSWRSTRAGASTIPRVSHAYNVCSAQPRARLRSFIRPAIEEVCHLERDERSVPPLVALASTCASEGLVGVFGRQHAECNRQARFQADALEPMRSRSRNVLE